MGLMQSKVKQLVAPQWTQRFPKTIRSRTRARRAQLLILALIDVFYCHQNGYGDRPPADSCSFRQLQP